MNAPPLQLGCNWSRPESPDKELCRRLLAVRVLVPYIRDDMHADSLTPHARPDHLLMH